MGRLCAITIDDVFWSLYRVRLSANAILGLLRRSISVLVPRCLHLPSCMLQSTGSGATSDCHIEGCLGDLRVATILSRATQTLRFWACYYLGERDYLQYASGQQHLQCPGGCVLYCMECPDLYTHLVEPVCSIPSCAALCAFGLGCVELHTPSQQGCNGTLV